ncbi:MAG: triphosphoribosyl-dephospho-CoA synthase CitG [Selenomonadaceae bacterium]|nr:triphosphoribosyl-dephospho-CoA synthase CitG [Selenomonadaceae bacterium]
MQIPVIGDLAHEAMLCEVSATPKPGLVDRATNGAHRDMDFFTFLSSATALRCSFDGFARLGAEHAAEPVMSLLPYLQQAGLAAERRMFAATHGVNTHKGMIFSLGLLCGAAGWTARRGEPLHADHLCTLVAEMCAGLTAAAYAHVEEKPAEARTKGEAMFLRYGVTGVRGEAESGFATVRLFALPVYRTRREAGVSVNDALCDTLLVLIARNMDTNILGRHDMETLRYAQRAARNVAMLDGMHTEAGCRAIRVLDDDFTQRWISPGGSADLLAVTHFLYEIEHRFGQGHVRPAEPVSANSFA